jgi:hypothetical protein
LGLDSSDESVGATNFAELVAKLTEILTTSKSTKKDSVKSCVIALSNAEILRHLDSFLLPGLLHLAQLTQLNICVIFISRIPWSRWQIIQVS